MVFGSELFKSAWIESTSSEELNGVGVTSGVEELEESAEELVCVLLIGTGWPVLERSCWFEIKSPQNTNPQITAASRTKPIMINLVCILVIA